MPEELWTEVHDIVEEVGIKTISKKKKCKKAKWMLQIAVKEEKPKAKEKRRLSFKCRVTKNSMER